MRTGNIAKRGATIAVILALCVAFLPGPAPVQAAVMSDNGWTIVFDYSHGQYSSYVELIDEWIEGNLSERGFTVIWALGGLNDSILADADALILGAIYGPNGFTAAEVTAVGDWFNEGHKFLWVGGDSDYDGALVTNNMTLILEEVGSHVYHEPTAIEDPVSNCGGQGYRAVANGTSDDAFVAGIVEGVDAVLMHGPTMLYGSDSDTPGENVDPVALETVSIDNVYPLLYYGGSATIADGDVTYPYAHTDGDIGGFVAATLEVAAGTNETSVIIVSGASPYGDYSPMINHEYKGVPLNGEKLVVQGITVGLEKALYIPPTPPADMTMIYLAAGIGVIVIIIIVVVIMKKR